MNSQNDVEFDRYAADYEQALAEGLSVSGEDSAYFAHSRVQWLDARLRKIHHQPKAIMDFGCGIGTATPFLLNLTGVESVLGVDVSTDSLRVAEQTYQSTHQSQQVQFQHLEQYSPRETIDLVYCNGVFHHIPPDERAATIDYIYRSLRRGGIFAFWENNPWNPGTRYVMSRIPFDRDAITLNPPEARHLVEAGGFEVLRTDYLFIFPNFLRWFRGIEPKVAHLPLGAQYQILCQKSHGTIKPSTAL